MALILLEDFLRFPLKLLRFVSFDFRKMSRKRKFKENLQILVHNFLFLFSLANVYGFVTASVFLKVQKSSDFIAVTPFVTTTLTVVKSLTLFCNKSKLCRVLVDLRKLFAKDEKKQKKFDTAAYLGSYRRFFRTYFLLVLLPCLTVIAIPVGKLVISGEKNLPLDLKISLKMFE
jgi:hypothetical protein